MGTAVAPAVLAASCRSESTTSDGAPNINTGKKYRWKMVTTWPPKFPVLGEGAELFAKNVKEMSGGRLDIKVFGGGELVPALEVFDAVSQGVAECASGAAYYWAGKSPAFQFFGAVPFGMNAQQINAWLKSGGMELWEELYAKFNLIPFPAGNTGVQAGGWFNKEINSIDDFKGLKMRIPGLGGKVLEKAGGTAVLSPGGEIYTNLERGVIDATEWVGPYHDYKMGFHKIAKYCYYPGWHEQGTLLEIFCNKVKFEALPADLQAIVRAAATISHDWVLAEFDAQNALYLQKLKEEGAIELRQFPDEVIDTLRGYAKEVVDNIAANDPDSKKIYDHYQNFRKTIIPYSEITEKAFYNKLEE